MERPLGVRETAVHRRGEEASRRSHEGAPGLQVQTQEEDEDPREETGEVPVGRWRVVRRGRSATDGSAVGTAAAGRVPDDAERVHAQWIHDARPECVPAASVRIPALRRVADAAGRLRWRVLRRRAGLAVPAAAAVAVGVRHGAGFAGRVRTAAVVRVALAQRLVGQVGAGVTGPAGHEARVRAARGPGAAEARVRAAPRARARPARDEARVRAAGPEPHHQHVPRARRAAVRRGRGARHAAHLRIAVRVRHRHPAAMSWVCRRGCLQ